MNCFIVFPFFLKYLLNVEYKISSRCFWAMDVEKNFTSFLDREVYKPFSFGRHETQKITWSFNPPIKVTLFWSHQESKKVTGTGHNAWTSWRTQEARKTTDAMAWQQQGSNRPMIGRPKRSNTRYEKKGIRWWKKRLRIKYEQIWSEFRRRQWQTTPVQLTLPRKSSVGSPGV